VRLYRPCLRPPGALTIAVATDGQCPGLAGVLREELDCDYGAEYGELLRLMNDLRRQMIAFGWSGPRIRAVIRELYRDGIIEAIAMGVRRLLCEFLESRLGAEFDVHPGVLARR
jgi:precorrin-2 dehydrogenase/sirohydrochlorin ferrochelatase